MTTTPNSIRGTINKDTLFGTSAIDLIEGLDQDDILFGFGENDTIYGGDGNDHLNGGTGNDLLDGGKGQDTVEGGTGSDRILHSEGNDRIDGGLDWDELDYSAATSSISLNAAIGRVALANGEVDRITGFEAYKLTQLTDRFVGSAGDDHVWAGNGADMLDGGAGWDISDYQHEGLAINADLATGKVVTASGTDTLRIGSFEEIRGSAFDDIIKGDEKGNSLRGRAGNDTLDGGDGNDTADYQDSTAAVTVNLATTSANDGMGGTDLLINMENIRGSNASAGDTLTGSEKNNSIRGMKGADTIDGKEGYDTASHSSDIDANNDGIGAIINLHSTMRTATIGTITVTINGRQALDSWGDIDTLINIEGARGSRFDDLLYGADRTKPNFGASNDRHFDSDRSYLEGGEGNDTLIGVSPDDGVMAQYFGSMEGVVVNLSASTYTDTATGLEIAGLTAYDGLGGVDTLINIAGAEGSEHDDIFIGSSQADYFKGMKGNDYINGGAGSDRVGYSSGLTPENGVTVDLEQDVAYDQWGNTDQLISIEYASGSRYSDTFYGDTGANRFFGDAGGDYLDGGQGSDTAEYSYLSRLGGTGARINLSASEKSMSAQGVAASAIESGTARDGTDIDGGALDTLVSIENITGSFLGDAIWGSAGTNLLSGLSGNDRIWGDGGNDTIDGGLGSDILSGDDGNDVLRGAGGADRMTGGNNADKFVFKAGDTGIGTAKDIITDFNRSQGDKIDLAGIDANIGLTSDQSFTFISSSSFSGVAGQLRFASGILQGDWNGDKVVDFEVSLLGMTSMSTSDFVL